MSQETGPSVMKVEELILTGQWVVDLWKAFWVSGHLRWVLKVE